MGFLLNGHLDIGVHALAKRDFNGIAGVETASGYWGLSAFLPEHTILMVNDDTLDENGRRCDLGVSILAVPKLNTENVVHLSEHFRVTDLEQTVIDMIRYNRHEFHLYETLISAIDSEEADIERLNNLAKRYGVYDKMYRQLELALQAEREDAE